MGGRSTASCSARNGGVPRGGLSGPIDPEAAGTRARLTLVDLEIAEHTKNMEEASLNHWRHHFEHELYDALRRKDCLRGDLLSIRSEGRRIQ